MIERRMVEDWTCKAINGAVKKGIINRLPRKTLLWSRFAEAITPLLRGETGLDLGCGRGSQLPFDRLQWIGVDIDLPSLRENARKHNYHTLVRADLRSVERVFRPRCVDVVVALDLLEHFDKPDARELLTTMERLARQRVIVLMPNGYLEQDPRAVTLNPWMEHRCGWSVDEMRGLGYVVQSWSGWKALAGPGAYLWRRLDSLFQLATTISQPLIQQRPEAAFHLLCWKDMTGVGLAER